MMKFMTKKYSYFKYIFAFAAVSFVVLCHADHVHAADGRVIFGSDGYEWEIGEESPIGVYVEGDVPFIGYELYLKYDPTALAYVDGATYEENGMLYITETGDEAVYKTMLHFIPLRTGNTSISVIAVNCAVGGESIEGVAAEVLNMTQLSEASIHVKDKGSSKLAALSISPAEIKDFNPDTVEYQLSVSPETEKLNVRYTTEAGDANVTVSDTKLEPGENIITITVHGASDTTIYALKVMREYDEPASEENASEESLPEEGIQNIGMTEAADVEPSERNAFESTDTFSEETGDMVLVPIVPDETELFSEESQAEAKIENNAEASTDWLLWIAAAMVILLIAGYGEYLIITHQRAFNKDNSRVLTEHDAKGVSSGQKVIDIKNVTMKFRMASEEASSLKEYVIRLLKHQLTYRRFTALENISFEVMQGEVIGIIGTNGSGKSTLLKIISGALNPTSGIVDVDKRKVQMLTLGTGFDMELTARENVYLNGAIIGYTKEYIDKKYDDIVSFAELEGFMEERMKNFSSGMVSRLGFAIATMRDAPDILILDEVLSVGDMFFRKKSEQRIKEMIHSGATVLIVSHSMDTIMKNCDRVVWIEKGKLKKVGNAKEVCEAYGKQDKMLLEGKMDIENR